MAFDEKVRIIIEAVGTGKAAADIKSLDRAMDSSGKSATGWQQNLSKVGTFIGNNLPALAIAGGAAVVAFAAKSVSAFQDTALSAGKLADSTGLTVEAASRWAEVAGDVGVSTETLGTTFGFLLKSIGKSPEKFRELGITAQDSSGQIQQAIDVLNRAPEGAERAALGAQLFGKSWASMSELIAQGSDKIKQNMAEVSDAKLINDEELAKARQYRASMDELSDSIEDVSLTIGQALVPGLAKAASGFAKLLQSGPVQEFIETLGAAAEAIGEVLANISDLNGTPLTFSVGEQALKDYNTLLKDFGGTWTEVLAHYQEMARTGGAGGKDALALILNMKQAADDADETIGTMGLAYETAAERGHSLVSATEEIVDVQKKAADTANTLAAAYKNINDEAATQLDAFLTLPDAIDEQAEAFNDLASAIGDFKKQGTPEHLAKVENAAKNLAKADTDLARATAESNGKTFTQKDALDATNRSLLTQASNMQGPAKQAILDRIAALNGIPAVKLTDIKAKLDAGDIAGAERILNSTSRARDAAIRAEATNVQYTEQQLANLARNRRAIIHVEPVGGGRTSVLAGGAARGAIIPGSYSQESAGWTLHGSEVVLNPAQQARVLWNIANGGGGSGNGGGGKNITVNVSGADPQAVVNALDQYVRVHGARRLQSMVS